MATYVLPNIVDGGIQQVTANSLAEAQQQAANNTGVSLAQQQAGGTFGSNSVVGGDGGSSGGGGGGGGGGGSASQSSDADAIQAAFAASSGISIKELEERKRQFDAELAWKEKQWEREGLPRLEIEQRKQALAEQEYQTQRELARGNLALSYLQTASQMGGPKDVFQFQDFLRGAQQQGDLPVWLKALASGINLPTSSGVGNQQLQPETMGTLSAKLTGQAPQSSYNLDQALNTIASIFQQGPNALRPGTLERLDQGELATLTSGGQKAGVDVPAWLRAYERAGIGQRAGSPI